MHRASISNWARGAEATEPLISTPAVHQERLPLTPSPLGRVPEFRPFGDRNAVFSSHAATISSTQGPAGIPPTSAGVVLHATGRAPLNDAASGIDHRSQNGELSGTTSGPAAFNTTGDESLHRLDPAHQPDFSVHPTSTLTNVSNATSGPGSPSSTGDLSEHPSARNRAEWEAGASSSGQEHLPRNPNSFAGSPASTIGMMRGLIGLQVHHRYLVTENEEGMVIIDQHALHERILYEQLRERVLAGRMEMQRLLIPEPVSLTASEAAAALEARDTLAQLGITIEPFGGATVMISSYPAMLANMSPQEVLRLVLDLLIGGERVPDRRDLLDELLHMISCKAAIKAGDRLSPEEITALLEQRHFFQDTHHCPHGRPTALVFSREELDKRFKRI